ncbi:hypothetical protein AAMO2058_000317800 [Amorphochlora amoebiformis]|mmetsp:Transcript_9513/g.15062  ORF Transcript_9513/g.15062 Transcript_9513/m.15062 type:complete len:158 (-) Transcript_9513:2-475(-)
MGSTVSCVPRCCRCFSSPLQFLQMKRPPGQEEEDFGETNDLLDEENYRSALAYSEEHIQVLVDHQMSTLADRLAALDSQMLQTPESGSRKNIKARDDLLQAATEDALFKASLEGIPDLPSNMELSIEQDLLDPPADSESDLLDPLPALTFDESLSEI